MERRPLRVSVMDDDPFRCEDLALLRQPEQVRAAWQTITMQRRGPASDVAHSQHGPAQTIDNGDRRIVQISTGPHGGR